MIEKILINGVVYKKPLTLTACDLISVCSDCVYNKTYLMSCDRRKELIELEKQKMGWL